NRTIDPETRRLSTIRTAVPAQPQTPTRKTASDDDLQPAKPELLHKPLPNPLPVTSKSLVAHGEEWWPPQDSNLTVQTGPSRTQQHQTIPGQRLQGQPGITVQLRKKAEN